MMVMMMTILVMMIWWRSDGWQVLMKDEKQWCDYRAEKNAVSKDGLPGAATSASSGAMGG